MQRPVGSDQPQHDLVAQRLAAQRQLDLVTFGHARARRRRWRLERQPAVAAQAAVPAHAIALARQRGVGAADVGRVGAREHVPPPPARQQLVGAPRPSALRGHDAGGWRETRHDPPTLQRRRCLVYIARDRGLRHLPLCLMSLR